jgi:hypothetical protein
VGSETRKKTRIVRVRVTPQEWASIESLVDTCSLSVPEFMRQMAIGYTPKSTLDAQAIIEMAQVNGDMVRVVGILKLWLSTESKKDEAFTHNIPRLINELRALKEALRKKVDKL